jgi:hypothetical protein
MRTRILLVAVALAAIAGTASASRFRFSSADRGFRLVWTELRLEVTFNGTPYSVMCPVTLEGSLHSATIAKVAGALIGSVTRAAAAEAACRGMIGSESPYPLEITVLKERLPWHLRYESFTGILPNINGLNVQVVGAAFEVHDFIFELTCLFASTAESPMRLILTRELRTGGLTSGRVNSTALIPRVRGILCSRTATPLGTIERGMTLLGNTVPLTLTLI